jgi:hypothetical protein
MRHQSLDEISAYAVVADASRLATREQRLRRWADLLEDLGPRPLQAFQWVEFYAEPERRRLRHDGSAISVAFDDPLLRAAGLAGDTLWDAQQFFGISRDQTHRLVCDCRYHGRMTGRTVGRRVRDLGRGGLIGHLARIFG